MTPPLKISYFVKFEPVYHAVFGKVLHFSKLHDPKNLFFVIFSHLLLAIFGQLLQTPLCNELSPHPKKCKAFSLFLSFSRKKSTYAACMISGQFCFSAGKFAFFRLGGLGNLLILKMLLGRGQGLIIRERSLFYEENFPFYLIHEKR